MKALLLIYTLGTLTDYWTTAWAVARGAREVTPLIVWVIGDHGMNGFLCFKIMSIILVYFVVWATMKDDKWISEAIGAPYNGGRQIAFVGMWLAALGQWLIVGSNFWQMRIAMALGL